MINKNLPTKLFLNGPELSFTTQPGDVTTSSGIATFTGIATATFPAGNPGVSDGTITFEWYYDGNKVTSKQGESSVDDDEGKIETVGTASTLTLSGLTASDNLKQVYAIANYTPTAYSQPVGSDVVAGTARSTGNPFNEPVQSNSAILTVTPEITIDTQPEDSVVAAELDHTYTIAASVNPPGPTLQYQWQLDGVDLTDGVVTSEVLASASGVLTITDDDAGTSTEVDFGQVSVYNSFTPGKTYTLRASSNIVTTLDAKGAGGGTSSTRTVKGGAGGKATGKFTFVKDQIYKLQVGSKGGNGDTGTGGFPGGGTGGRGGGNGGAGGGYTGLFITSVTQANSVLIAGAGGGGSNDPANGGAGGGETGNSGSNGGRAGSGGTQSAGGSGSGAGQAGSALQGGQGAGGGGGGYFGGGGGQEVSGCCADGAGGGGSGFKHGTLITDGVLTTGAGAEPATDGSFSITLISTDGSEITTTSTTVSGATTPTLTINSETGGISGVVRCIVTAAGASNSPLTSNEVNYSNLIPRDILNFESYRESAKLVNINTLSYTMYEETDGKDVFITPSIAYQENPNARIATNIFQGEYIGFYAPEKDVYLELELYGGQGKFYNKGGVINAGGKGGYAKIRFTAQKNEEYVITGLRSSSAIFLYRQSNLIAVVGEGGAGAQFSKGGDGGGIGQAGTNSGGSGGAIISEGSLGENGTWGGRANPSEVYPEDNQVPGTAAGQTIKCTKGDYWRDQGLSACSSITGLTKFRYSDGTEVDNSGQINRGFKAGYAINSTGGAGKADGSGRGGHGATGGRGDTGGNGGGGGSGYTDGSLTYVVENTTGWNNSTALVKLRLATTATDPVPVPPPPEERIVRWSVSRNTGDSNTVTFSKQSGIGPSSITFGPNSSTINTLIGAGAVYTRTSSTNSGPGSLGFRLSGNTLGLDDRQGAGGDNDYNDLTVTPSQGRFTSDSRWEANW